MLLPWADVHDGTVRQATMVCWRRGGTGGHKAEIGDVVVPRRFWATVRRTAGRAASVVIVVVDAD